MANKITQAEIDAVNVASNAGDTLTGTTTENKRVFDALPEFIITKYNTFVDWVIANFISEDKLTDLNSLTAKYTAAAAVTNGDFKCTLTGLSTLTSGDVVKVSFPSATDKTKVARLSVDNGTTYKNIYMGENLLASAVENKEIELMYNGTQFEPMCEITDTNANGTWIKKPDGTMTCTKSVSKTSIISGISGNLYSDGLNNINLGSWAKTFNAVPIATYGVRRASGDSNTFIDAVAYVSSSSAGYTSAYATISKTASLIINCHAIGFWK